MRLQVSEKNNLERSVRRKWDVIQRGGGGGGGVPPNTYIVIYINGSARAQHFIKFCIKYVYHMSVIFERYLSIHLF